MSDSTSAPPQTVVVHEWRITGNPGQGYPYYTFVFRDDDPRWSETGAKTKARAQQAAMAEGNTWVAGPYLDHRTVTYTEWTAVRD